MLRKTGLIVFLASFFFSSFAVSAPSQKSLEAIQNELSREGTPFKKSLELEAEMRCWHVMESLSNWSRAYNDDGMAKFQINEMFGKAEGYGPIKPSVGPEHHGFFFRNEGYSAPAYREYCMIRKGGDGYCWKLEKKSPLPNGTLSSERVAIDPPGLVFLYYRGEKSADRYFYPGFRVLSDDSETGSEVTGPGHPRKTVSARAVSRADMRKIAQKHLAQLMKNAPISSGDLHGIEKRVKGNYNSYWGIGPNVNIKESDADFKKREAAIRKMLDLKRCEQFTDAVPEAREAYCEKLASFGETCKYKKVGNAPSSNDSESNETVRPAE